jgi:3-oxoacyl-(acyl-carrier-protein) synthase
MMILDYWIYPSYAGLDGPKLLSTACAISNSCILNAANHIRKGEGVGDFIFLWSILL